MTATDATPSAAQPAAVILDETAQRRELACRANQEISALATELAQRFDGTKDGALIHGMAARIQLLTDVQWHALNLAAHEPEDVPELVALRRHFEGWVS
jgi:hypothetical protein